MTWNLLHFNRNSHILFLAPKAYAMNLLIILSILTVLALAAVVMLVRKLVPADTNLPLTAEWIDELSIERYRPMLHLLDSDDLEFLRSQPGFTPAMAAKLRMQRCQIFRGYLRCLRADFRRVSAALKILMLHSRYDRPDLASVLVHHQVMFEFGMCLVGFRLFLYRMGLCGVDVTDLVKIFDMMRLELKRLVPATAAMSA
jgi:hypothetical protein